MRFVVALWFLLAAAAPAWAAGGGETPAGRKMQMTETVTAADFEKIEGGPLLIAAYAVVWVIFFVAIVWLFVRLRRVSAEVRRLEGRLEEGEKK
jgi:CcmD family protein